MKKHLIVHGDVLTGKSLFIKNLLSYRKYFQIDCRKPKVFTDTFYWQMSHKDKDTEVIWFQDIDKKADMDLFISLTGMIRINPRYEEIFYIKPTLVLEFSQEIKNFPVGTSLTRRFDIINTNTITYKELINFMMSWNNKK